MRYLPENNLAYPVLLLLSDGSSGSGFYLKCSDGTLYLVTAHHVLFNKVRDSLEPRSQKLKLISYDANPKIQDRIVLAVNFPSLNIKQDVGRDVVVIEIGGSVSAEEAKKKLEKVVFKDGVKCIAGPKGGGELVWAVDDNLKKYEDVLISNEVFIMGYPNSLGISGKSQIRHDMPLLRKGIIAGKNSAQETIILDCPAYPGNSGGIAIEVEETEAGKRRFSIIGVVIEFIPFVEEMISRQLRYTNKNIENSGYSVVVSTNAILNLINK